MITLGTETGSHFVSVLYLLQAPPPLSSWDRLMDKVSIAPHFICLANALHNSGLLTALHLFVFSSVSTLDSFIYSNIG